MIRKIRIAVAVAGAVLLASAVVISGVIPIQASSGHWRATASLLDFIKRRSVNTHSLFVATPNLDHAPSVVRGAAHFESGCRPCHGSPISARPPMVMKMTPHPPELSGRIGRWQPRELFQIVKHGIKFTGMPAWQAAQRDDEVWAIVAFLRALPEMSGPSYKRMAFGDAVAPPARPAAVDRCARCHGWDGLGRDGAFPVLAGQRREYLRGALEAYSRAQRHSGIMTPEAATLDDNARLAVADYFSALTPPTEAPASHSRGARIATAGIPARQVPACIECHGPERNPAYPLLAGQPADYLVEQLQLFSEGRRGGSPFATIMEGIAPRLTGEEMRDAAEYFTAAPSTSRQ